MGISFSSLILLMFTRILALVAVQIVAFAIEGSWNATVSLWPFQAIAANLICIPIMIWQIRKANSSLWEVYRGLTYKRTGVVKWFPDVGSTLRFYLKFAAGFLGILLVLGLPSLAFNEVIGTFLNHQVGISVSSPYPKDLFYVVIVFLPLTEMFVEVPWYFGVFNPLMENALATGRKSFPFLPILLLTAVVYALQHSFMPFVPNATYFVLKSLSMFPLVFTIGLIVRILPRSMPFVMLLHMGMAIVVSFQFA